MIRAIKDSLGALKRTQECLLISYHHDAKTLVVVLDYHDKSAESDRAFLRLHFHNVSKFKRVPGATADLQRFNDSYSTRMTSVATVVEEVDVKKKLHGLDIVLWFGHSFGGLSFTCQSVSGEARDTRATKAGADAWHYRDTVDGSAVDFYAPFG